jgi:hypothetical protein
MTARSRQYPPCMARRWHGAKWVGKDHPDVAAIDDLRPQAEAVLGDHARSRYPPNEVAVVVAAPANPARY